MSEVASADRVLVTGACGFLGRHLISRLVAESVEVLAIDLPDAAFDVLPGVVNCVSADLRDPPAYAESVTAFAPTKVAHLAALIDNRREFSLFSKLFDVNLGGSVALVSVLRAVPGLRAVVHTSTGEEYGDVEGPRCEDVAPRPVSPYSASKAAVTAFLAAAHAMDGFPAITTRMFLPYGSGAASRFFVCQLIDALIAGKPFPMTKGEQTRDFLHVDDVVDGLVRILACEALIGQTVNLCSGIGTPLIDLGRTAERLARDTGCLGDGFELKVGELPYRRAEVMSYVGDPSKLVRHLDWRPRVTLEEGITRMLKEASGRG